ncbi:MAG TPA: hypothetical protein PL045_08330, partial [Chitinophagaceae bacterium]|nr:hypothetical protein [Chitinophagaceae bacterium]
TNTLNSYGMPVPEHGDAKNVILYYRAYDNEGTEVLRLAKKPLQVLLNNKPMNEIKNISEEGFIWKALNSGGVLTVQRKKGNNIMVME